MSSNSIKLIFEKYKKKLDPLDEFYLNYLFVFFLKTIKLTNRKISSITGYSLGYISYVRTKKLVMSPTFYHNFINSLLEYMWKIIEAKPDIFEQIVKVIDRDEDQISKEDLLYLSKLSDRLKLSRKCLRLFYDKELIVEYRIDYIAFLTFAYRYCSSFENTFFLLKDEQREIETCS